MSTITSYNPATGEKIGEVPNANEAEVHMAVRKAREAQRAWQALGFRGRGEVLLKVRAALLEKMEEVARVVARENGKPVIEAVSQDVMILLDVISFYAKQSGKILKTEKIKLGKWSFFGHKSELEFEPRGVVAVIGPWNYPISNPFSPAVMGLMAGNAVIVKPSEFTPFSALKVLEVFSGAGFPTNVLQVLTGDGLTGAALIKERVDHVSFIGSVATGKKIMAACAEHLIPLTLELGGKDPFVVLEDADIDLASSAAVWGAYTNCGQVCASVERVYVHEKIAEPFTKMVVEKASKLRLGKGEEDFDIGSMTAKMQMDKVFAHVEEAKRKGAKVLLGGEADSSHGPQFFKPTVLANVDHDFSVVKDETFGPVLPIMTFRTEEEVVRMANDSVYGLNAYIWTKDVKRGRKLASRIDAGTVNVNETVFTFGVPQTPWGGMKESGMGRTHGAIGLFDMVKIRHVYMNKRPSKKNSFWWFGYSPDKKKAILALSQMLFGKGWPRIKGALTYLRLMGKVKTM